MTENKLQQWADEHTPADEMMWKSSFWRQIVFVRDEISCLLSRNYEESETLPQVFGTHCSKSIVCPVYFFDLPWNGIRIWMRYNFYDWNISIESEEPITCDFLNTFNDSSSYRFCQGMEDKKFERYAQNNKQFTICIISDYDVYTFFRVLRKFLNIKTD